MRVDRVSIRNFKCYEDIDLRLDSGVTVIHGVNGSGKSSLLEACFFALYGARALDATLADVVTIGADETEIELWFTHAGSEYHLRRRIRATGDRPTTAECVLEGPEATFEGARDVRSRVTELLRMDHEAFVNCAYVRQGEVNKLINASAADRQDMIDDLLQLGKLEEYRQRASEARVGVGRVRDDKQGALAQIDEQIADKEDRDLHERLNALESELSELDEEIERYEENKANAESTLEDAESVLEEYADKREELTDLEAEIADLQEQIAATERERETLSEEISERRSTIESQRETIRNALAETEVADDADAAVVDERLEAVADREQDLRDDLEEHRLTAQKHDSEAESLRESAESLAEQATEKRERADRLEREVEDAEETLTERREELETLEDRIESTRAVFEDAPVAFGEAESHRDAVAADLDECRETLAGVSARIDQKQEAIAEAEALLEAGKCPECGQSVEGAPHVESLADDREELSQLQQRRDDLEQRRETLSERLDRAEELVDAESEVQRLTERRDTVEQLVDDQAASIESDREEITDLREAASELDEQATQKRDAAEEAEQKAAAAREQVGTVNEKLGALRDEREQLQTAAEAFEAIECAETEIANRRDRREQLATTNDERRERLADKRSRREELRETIDESSIETAREERDRAEAYLEQVETKLSELAERREQLQNSVGAVRQELEELESLRERREELSATLERLESLYEETESLESMYGQLRAELRQRNVETLERMLNDTFELVYRNASYDRIELDGEYELTIYQKDGEALDPEQLSGGERALFNLSLRCAIYRLLAEGIEGAAPMPPLVLDEPTVFLDSGHVSQLVVLIERMRELGVEQIIVVSHDEELVGAADSLVTVEKDSTTNRSSARRTETALPIGDQ